MCALTNCSELSSANWRVKILNEPRMGRSVPEIILTSHTPCKVNMVSCDVPINIPAYVYGAPWAETRASVSKYWVTKNGSDPLWPTSTTRNGLRTHMETYNTRCMMMKATTDEEDRWQTSKNPLFLLSLFPHPSSLSLFLHSLFSLSSPFPSLSSLLTLPLTYLTLLPSILPYLISP